MPETSGFRRLRGISDGCCVGFCVVAATIAFVNILASDAAIELASTDSARAAFKWADVAWR